MEPLECFRLHLQINRIAFTTPKALLVGEGMPKQMPDEQDSIVRGAQTMMKHLPQYARGPKVAL